MLRRSTKWLKRILFWHQLEFVHCMQDWKNTITLRGNNIEHLFTLIQCPEDIKISKAKNMGFSSAKTSVKEVRASITIKTSLLKTTLNLSKL
jgi:hypothetical protein